MQYRKLGRTDLAVSTIGFGCWGIGGTMWIGARDDESLAALRRAVELEYTFFDTAAVYGPGHSERLLGQLIREYHGKTPSGRRIAVATKVPPKNYEWPARRGVSWKDTFPPDHIVSYTEKSLSNLGLETIDLQQLHVWQDIWLDAADAWYPAVERLKREGKIRCFGISINDHDPGSAIRAVESGLIDTVQVIYNIFDQLPEDALFAATVRHNVGVIVRVPLDEGGLTGAIGPETKFPAHDFRNHYFSGERKREVQRRVEAMAPLLRESGAGCMAEMALRFCFSHPAVSTVIPGMRTCAHVESNARTSDAGPLSEMVRAVLKGHKWERNWYR